MGEVVPVLFSEGQAIPPDQVLTKAMGNLNKVVVIGLEDNGDLYIASSHDTHHVSHLLILAQGFIYEMAKGE